MLTFSLPEPSPEPLPPSPSSSAPGTIAATLSAAASALAPRVAPLPVPPGAPMPKPVSGEVVPFPPEAFVVMRSESPASELRSTPEPRYRAFPDWAARPDSTRAVVASSRHSTRARCRWSAHRPSFQDPQEPDRRHQRWACPRRSERTYRCRRRACRSRRCRKERSLGRASRGRWEWAASRARRGRRARPCRHHRAAADRPGAPGRAAPPPEAARPGAPRQAAPPPEAARPGAPRQAAERVPQQAGAAAPRPAGRARAAGPPALPPREWPEPARRVRPPRRSPAVRRRFPPTARRRSHRRCRRSLAHGPRGPAPRDAGGGTEPLGLLRHFWATT